MTPTASFKDKFKQACSMLKWEIKSCSGTLTVYTILAAVSMAIILTLTLVFGVDEGTGTKSENIKDAIEGFQMAGLAIIQALTVVFSIVYTVKMYSYLHNKRQTDLYGALPISRVTLYLSKSFSAILFSVIPAFVFYGLIALVAVVFKCEMVDMLGQVMLDTLLLAFTCVTSYGVISVCCGTTVNAVIMFLAISFSFPVTVYIATGVANGLFIGSDLSLFIDSFVATALTPTSASSDNHPIYWCIFTVVCIAAGIYLVKHRKAERAQESFAYYLPCHIVKLLVSFFCGTFLGMIFASIDTFGNGYLGFVFGFLLASIAAFIIAHLIFYKGFSKLIKTSIPYAVMVVVVLAAVGLANIDVFGFNSRTINPADVESAGYAASDDYYTTEYKKTEDVLKDIRDDFTSESDIKLICDVQKTIVENVNMDSSSKFQYAWSFVGDYVFDGMLSDGKSIFSFKMKDGTVINRCYNSSLFMFDTKTYNKVNPELSKIEALKIYQQNYSAMMNFNTKDISYGDLTIAGNSSKYAEGAYINYYISNEENEYGRTDVADEKIINEIVNAYRKDLNADEKDIKTALFYISQQDDYYDYSYDWDLIKANCKDAVCLINLNVSSFDENVSIDTETSPAGFGTSLANYNETFVVPKSYTNTIKVLQKLNVLTDDLNVDGIDLGDDGYYDGEIYDDTYGIDMMANNHRNY